MVHHALCNVLEPIYERSFIADKDRLRVRGYVRYVDDFVLFGHTKEELHAARALVSAENPPPNSRQNSRTISRSKSPEFLPITSRYLVVTYKYTRQESNL